MIGERGLVVKARFRFCLLLSAAALAAVAALVFFGVLPLNAPPEDRYPVRGVDVSAHQGVIDWPMLAAQGVEFAFIKATEGSGFTDARFSFNVLQARNAGLRVGAYHFFSFESSGDAQADNFIAVVEPFAGMLPPVVDLEYYAGFFDDPPAAEPVRAELDALLERLRAHYGVQPILYVTEASYARYIAGVPAYAGWTFGFAACTGVRAWRAGPSGSIPTARGWTATTATSAISTSTFFAALGPNLKRNILHKRRRDKNEGGPRRAFCAPRPPLSQRSRSESVCTKKSPAFCKGDEARISPLAGFL